MPNVNKQAVAAAFGRAANTYEDHAELQRIAGDRLLTLAGTTPVSQVLDAGCGTGWYARHWQAQGCDVTALDLSPQMLDTARRHGAASRYLCGDIEHIPLADAAVDLAWSNLAVQWCSELSHGLSELRRVTRPGGRVVFSTLGAGSLQELHQAWRGVDDQPHANRFLSRETVLAACGPGGEVIQEAVQCRFPDVMAAMRSLKGIGATHLHDGRQARVLTRGQLQRLAAAWPQQGGEYLLTYQLLYGVIHRD